MGLMACLCGPATREPPPPDPAEFEAPLEQWAPATLARWCAAQGDALRTPRVDVGALLAGVSGAELAGMSDYALDELGVPARMRAYLRASLLAPKGADTDAPVDAQLAAAEAEARELRRRLSAADAVGGEAPYYTEDGADADKVALLPAARPSAAALPVPAVEAPSAVSAQLVAGLAGALAATTAFVAGQQAKRERGDATLADTMSTSVALPYAWAASSAQFGLEWVKKALEVGEGVPMVGAVFTLCLIVAQSAEAAVANKAAAAALGALAVRVAAALAAADAATLKRASTGVGALQAALKDVVELIQAYSKRGWLRRLATAGGDAARFRILHDRIREEMATLSFDLQLAAPDASSFRDTETKALRSVVLAQTGRTPEEGGLEELLKRPGGAEALRGALGCEAAVLSAELGDIAAAVARVGAAADAALDLHLSRELRGAVQLNVSLAQPSKRSGGTGGATHLQQAQVRDGIGTLPRTVAAFRVVAGHPVECGLCVDSRDNTELRVRGIERVEQAGATYVPAPSTAASRRCCGGAAAARELLLASALGAALAESEAVLFDDEDVDISVATPRNATLSLRLPDDAGPTGQLLTLRLRLWVSFHPAPALGDSFANGKTVAVTQTLYLAVYKKGSARFQLREIEDAATQAKRGVARLGAPVLALPLLVHNRYVRDTEQLLRRQLVGWSDGSAYTVN